MIQSRIALLSFLVLTMFHAQRLSTTTATPISRGLYSSLFSRSIHQRAPTAAAMIGDPQHRRVPAEWEPHQRTIMGWPTHWMNLTPHFQADVARVAQAVSRFEPIQMLVEPEHLDQARQTVGKGVNHDIEFLPIPVNDLWARDFSPLFMVRGEGEKKELVGVDYNFQGWGEKAPWKMSHLVSRRLLEYWDHTPRVQSRMVAEGGGIESDGQGTLLMTESSIVNDNRNPNKTRSELEETFKQELGVTKVIWLKGLKGYDITDSHIDVLARFVAPGVVMVSKPPAAEDTQGLLHSERFQAWREQYAQAIEVLSSTMDATGQKLKIIDLPEPHPRKTRRIPLNQLPWFDEMMVQECEKDGSGGINSYLNFLMVNGGVVMAEFGDEAADRAAREIVQRQFPGREVVTVRIDYLVKGGGGIHCSTHDVPAV